MKYSQTSSLASRHPYAVLSSMLIGTLLGTLGNSTANIAVPAVMDEFSLPLSHVVWMVTTYTIIFAVLMPVSGAIGSRVGQKRLYMAGIALVGAAAVVEGTAVTFPALLAGRALQGIGIAPALPVIMVMIARSFPAEARGRAMGVWALVNGLGHAIGPLLGGLLIQHIGWRSIYWVNLPLSLINLYMVWKLVPADPQRQDRLPFDSAGALLLSLTALAFMLAVNQTARLGLLTPVAGSLWAAALILLVLFVRWEQRKDQPLVDLKLFRRRGYVASIVVISVDSFCLFGLMLALPVLLIREYGWPSQQAGLLGMLLPLVMALIGPYAGRLTDRRGSQFACTIGLSGMLLGGIFLLLTRLGYQQPVYWPVFIISLITVGVGMALVQSPVTAAAVQSVNAHEVGVATGIFHMIRFFMGAFGSTIFGLVVEAHAGGLQAGFYRSVWALLLAAAAGLVFARWLPGLAGRVASRPYSAGRAAG